VPLTRTTPLRRRRHPAAGRAALPADDWGLLVLTLKARAEGRCDVCKRRGPTDPHHIIPRSAGGPDRLWNLASLCRRCHEQVDAPFSSGRLVFVVFQRQPYAPVASTRRPVDTVVAHLGGAPTHVRWVRLRAPDRWAEEPTPEAGGAIDLRRPDQRHGDGGDPAA